MKLKQVIKNLSPTDQAIFIISLLIWLAVLLVFFVYLLFGNQLIEAIYKGESIELLNQIIANHRIQNPNNRNLDFYFLKGRVFLSRLVLMGIVGQLIVLAYYWRYQVLRTIENFFTAATHPINLAVFRVVFFGSFITINISNIVEFSQIPAELRVLPVGFGWLFSYLPINETLAKITGTLLLVFCFTAMIGLFTRTSALLTTVLGFYALAIPNLFGKVNHNDIHFLYFSAILAASGCGDLFSVDAILSAWKRSENGIVEPPVPSKLYTLPLRFIWLLMGIMYFFPGFWKLWHSGFDWFLSDNLKFMLYSNWHSLGGWMPFLRIDKYPLLYKLSAFGTILFEIAFIFLIFLPKLRILLAFGGIIFHSSIKALMNISFIRLQICYVAFFDWNAIFHWIGRRAYPEQMYVIYDGSCTAFRRSIAVLRVFDIFGRLSYINVLDNEKLVNHGLGDLNCTTLVRNVHTVVRRKHWVGFSAYRALAARIPIFWPVLLLMYLWPIPKIGNRIYWHFVNLNTNNTADTASFKATGYQYNRRLHSQAVVAVGILMLLGNVFYGIKGETEAWPFSCYPKFSGLAEPKVESLEIVALSSTGEIILWEDRMLKQKIGSVRLNRFKKLISNTIETEQDPVKLHTRLQEVWQAWSQNDPLLQKAASVQFYQGTLLTIPERRKENPIARKLLFELKS